MPTLLDPSVAAMAQLSSFSMYGMLPYTEQRKELPDGVLSIGDFEYAGHQKLKPRSMHNLTKEITLGVLGSITASIVSLISLMCIGMQCVAEMCPFAMVKSNPRDIGNHLSLLLTMFC